ncbi:uracil-DNA glycosylase family protein [Pseudomonas matsuisoli]|uniref:Uracil-DNA glycosylase-like domain-containing protein n=1 Tax=Pseudomonas matsuisoli TaxID=1515666 RepID=A0A917UVS3_9PSED|nr:uracil-DNA glycosylase family protein [Pseudomonas matsuisoli]GGJ88862.1 hypothetical protein GCM10009304_13060 [Pseudomonas matsuisoli]
MPACADATLPDAIRKAFRDLASQTPGIDCEVYQRFEKDPLEPIVGLGQHTARISFFGRDPGRDEVRHGLPFVGSGGQVVRKVIYRRLNGREMPTFEASLEVGRSFFWINTVPYKPLGNKAWSMAVKRRFHPLMRQLLIEQWSGHELITFGREAFLWFGIDQPKQVRDALEAFWRSDGRFTESIQIPLTTATGDCRVFSVHPLPHPSPLNQTWYTRFPALLNTRLQQLNVGSCSG